MSWKIGGGREKNTMNSEIYHKYQTLSQQWVETYENFMKAKLNERERLWDEFWPLMDEIRNLIRPEPELKDMFSTLRQEHAFDVFLMQAIYMHPKDEEFLDELRAYTHGEAIHFTKYNLHWLISLYERKPEFQQACHADPEVWEAFLYWQTEYHRLIANDDIFAAHALGGKLFRIRYRYPLVELDETECERLHHLYHTNPECREILEHNHSDALKVMKRLLEKYERRLGGTRGIKN
jgi:hypothetical protein